MFCGRAPLKQEGLPPDSTSEDLQHIGEGMLAAQNDHFSPGAKAAMAAQILARRAQAHFANARSILNALDRARLRAASRLLVTSGPVDADALSTIKESDIRASCVFKSGVAHE